MADITMCLNATCPNAPHCKRIQVLSSAMQSYAMFDYTLSSRGVECEHYLPLIRTTTTNNATGGGHG